MLDRLRRWWRPERVVERVIIKPERVEVEKVVERLVAIERLTCPFRTNSGLVLGHTSIGDGTHAWAMASNGRLYKRVDRRPDEWVPQSSHSTEPPIPTFVEALYDHPPTRLAMHEKSQRSED